MEQWEKDFENDGNMIENNIVNDDLKNLTNENVTKKRGHDKMIFYTLLVTILIVGGIAATYAYFKVGTTTSSSPTTVTATTDCMDIEYSEENVINLTYQYPIQDDYAVANVVPVTVKVVNRCDANLGDINYSLAFTSLAKDNNFISDNKIKMQVVKKVGNEEENVLKSTNYLNTLESLTTGNVYTALEEDLSKRAGISTYPTRTSYTIDNDSVPNSGTNIYKVYLWVDYYEGNPNPGVDLEADKTYNNSTQGKKFAGAISLVVNP